MKGYPRWFPMVSYGLLAFLTLSGIVLLPTMLAFRFEWEVAGVLSGGQRVPLAALHTAFSFLSLGLLGGLLAIHVRVGWRHGGNRVTGFLLVGALLVLMLSSLGLFYFGDEAAARFSCLLHVAAGLVLCLAFPVHFIRGKRLARQRLQAHRA